MRTQGRLLALLMLAAFSVPLHSQETGGETGDIIKSRSPDGRFGPRITSLPEQEAALIEKASGNALVNLGACGDPDTTMLVWSADSKRVAYATRFQKDGETHVYFWNGTAFEEVDLPDDLPGPKLKLPKNSDAKNYGGAETPLRWLKSGDLEMSSDLMMLSRDNGRTYTGVVRFIIAFDAQHHPSVKNVGKTKTRIDE